MTSLISRFLLLLACLGLASCVTSMFPAVDAIVWAPMTKESVFAIKDLTITTRPTTGNLKQMALDLAVVAARKSGLPMDGEASAPRFDLTVSLEEREFGVDIDTYNSVSAVFKIWSTGEEPRQVGQVTYSEETKKTLRSANYLEQVLESAFQQLVKRIQEGK